MRKRIEELLHYDQTAGALVWKVSRGVVKAGSVAGTKTIHGYIRIRIDGKDYRAHRLVWILHHAVIGQGMEIDHINGVRSDNRIENLRVVTGGVNTQNQRSAHANSRTKVLGVCKRTCGRFQAAIKVNGRNRHIGMFATAAEAHEAYLRAKREYHEGCTV